MPLLAVTTEFAATFELLSYTFMPRPTRGATVASTRSVLFAALVLLLEKNEVDASADALAMVPSTPGASCARHWRQLLATPVALIASTRSCSFG